MDAHLCGGLPSKSVTEIVGPSGAGKTQFCMMMACKSAMPVALGGNGGRVVYLDTEGSFSASRLREIAAARYGSYFDSEERLDELLAAVIVVTVRSSAELCVVLDELETTVLAEGVRLLVLDSVAARARTEFDATETVKRQAMLLEQAQALKQLAEQCNLHVVVSNQVTTKLDGVDDGVITAALGPLWAHAVNTRLVLDRLTDATAVGSRRLWAAKSPLCSVAHVLCDVTAAGLVAASLEMVRAESNYWGVGGAITSK